MTLRGAKLSEEHKANISRGLHKFHADPVNSEAWYLKFLETKVKALDRPPGGELVAVAVKGESPTLAPAPVDILPEAAPEPEIVPSPADDELAERLLAERIITEALTGEHAEPFDAETEELIGELEDSADELRKFDGLVRPPWELAQVTEFTYRSNLGEVVFGFDDGYIKVKTWLATDAKGFHLLAVASAYVAKHADTVFAVCWPDRPSEEAP